MGNVWYYTENIKRKFEEKHKDRKFKNLDFEVMEIDPICLNNYRGYLVFYLLMLPSRDLLVGCGGIAEQYWLKKMELKV